MWWVGEKNYAGPGQRFRLRLSGSLVRSVRAERSGRRIGLTVAVAVAVARCRHSSIVAKIANGGRNDESKGSGRPTGRTHRQRGLVSDPQARRAGNTILTANHRLRMRVRMLGRAQPERL